MRTTTVAAGGLRWRVERCDGTGDQSILLLHGFTGAAAFWHPVARRLGDRRLLIPDLPGHAGSEPPVPPEEWRIDRLAGSLVDLLDRCGVARADVVGYSMGARAALHLAVKAPERVRRLVLVSGSPGIDSPEERAERAASDLDLASRLERDGIERFVDHWESLPLFETQRRLPDAVRAEIRSIRLRHDASALAASLRAFGTGFQRPIHDLLPTLPMPVGIVIGEDDRKFRAIAGSMQAKIPHAAVEIVAGSGHAVPIECPDRFVAFLGSFLEGARERTRPSGEREERS